MSISAQLQFRSRRTPSVYTSGAIANVETHSVPIDQYQNRGTTSPFLTHTCGIAECSQANLYLAAGKLCGSPSKGIGVHPPPIPLVPVPASTGQIWVPRNNKFYPAVVDSSVTADGGSVECLHHHRTPTFPGKKRFEWGAVGHDDDDRKTHNWRQIFAKSACTFALIYRKLNSCAARILIRMWLSGCKSFNWHKWGMILDGSMV